MVVRKLLNMNYTTFCQHNKKINYRIDDSGGNIF